MPTVEQLRYLILAVQREGNRLLARSLKAHGITPSQAEVIRVLYEKGPLTLSGLGELLVCESGNSPSRLVDRLVNLGVVTSSTAQHDRRSVKLSLTSEGKRLNHCVIEVEKELYRNMESAAQGYDLYEISGFLTGFVAELPAGKALLRRWPSLAK